MKILVYGINFSPELTGIGKYTTEMCEWLADKGHEIRVVTAPPYYPAWKVAEGFSASGYTTENIGSVRVIRCPIWVPAIPTGSKRLLHLASFALSSLPQVLLQWSWRPDVIWLVAPPFFCAPAALSFGALVGAKRWLHIQDFEVDAAFELGILKGKLLRRIVLGVERWILRRFDRLSTISLKMVEKLSEKGVSKKSTVLFPNWVNVHSIRPGENGSVFFRELLGIAEGDIVALYSGNMGTKQGLEILAEIAVAAVNDSAIKFVFCGNGAGREALVKSCAGLKNVFFLDLQPVEKLSDLLACADVHLLPQRADAADLVMPSKLTGMLASGRPVVATAADGTELASVVSLCGVVVPPGDAVAMLSAIRYLAEDSDRRQELGNSARAYAEREMDREAVLMKFESSLHELVTR